MKKGELSINVIVVAAIGMLILVIISVLVFRSGGGLVEGTSCEGLGENIDAECLGSPAECGNRGGIVNRAAQCPTGTICCVMGSDN